MKRRQFLEVAGAASLAASWGQFSLRADGPTTDRCLLIVELNGGNDGLNTIVPREDARYFRARPTLAVKKKDTLRLTDELGLHPRLRALEKVWKEGKLAVVTNVGYPNPDRSHFRSMDIWQSGVPHRVENRRGWIGNALAARRREKDLDGLFAVGGGPAPLVFEGGPRAVTSLTAMSDLQLRGGALQEKALRAGLAPKPKTGTEPPALAKIRAASEHALALGKRLESASAGAKKVREAFPASPFAGQLALVMSLLDGGFRRSIFHVRLSGFDTHARQSETHPTLMGVLGDGLAAFQRELGKRKSAPAVTTFVFSEFGRRVRENGSAGTDHGAAGPVLLMGNGLKPGLHGSLPDLGDLDEGDLRHETDFRALGAELMGRWMSLPVAKDWKTLKGPRILA